MTMLGRFVIHEHHATSLHFDLRLEMDGVLKSWAVPKGVSMNPKDNRLAIRVGDHKLSYFSFEGTRRRGLYGAGEVCIWDKGEFEADDLAPADLRQGKLFFSLFGTKLRGRFKLEKWKS